MKKYIALGLTLASLAVVSSSASAACKVKKKRAYCKPVVKSCCYTRTVYRPVCYNPCNTCGYYNGYYNTYYYGGGFDIGWYW